MCSSRNARATGRGSAASTQVAAMPAASARKAAHSTARLTAAAREKDKRSRAGTRAEIEQNPAIQGGRRTQARRRLRSLRAAGSRRRRPCGHSRTRRQGFAALYGRPKRNPRARTDPVVTSRPHGDREAGRVERGRHCSRASSQPIVDQVTICYASRHGRRAPPAAAWRCRALPDYTDGQGGLGVRNRAERWPVCLGNSAVRTGAASNRDG